MRNPAGKHNGITFLPTDLPNHNGIAFDQRGRGVAPTHSCGGAWGGTQAFVSGHAAADSQSKDVANAGKPGRGCRPHRYRYRAVGTANQSNQKPQKPERTKPVRVIQYTPRKQFELAPEGVHRARLKQLLKHNEGNDGRTYCNVRAIVRLPTAAEAAEEKCVAAVTARVKQAAAQPRATATVTAPAPAATQEGEIEDEDIPF
jgi:hypothetical protein